jgi:hypothetical protein
MGPVQGLLLQADADRSGRVKSEANDCDDFNAQRTSLRMTMAPVRYNDWNLYDPFGFAASVCTGRVVCYRPFAFVR